MTVSVVIGANYGDEGKGLVTDWLCDGKTLNVRYNGGSQAGHTVVDRLNQPFVFSHFGAGTLKGSSTYLSSEFIMNPIFFNQEYDKLVARGFKKLRVYADPQARITTPFDMMINTDLETSRTQGKHGSCGAGIYETIKRNLECVGFEVKDLFHPGLKDSEVLVRRIRDESGVARLKELGLTDPSYFHDEGLLQRYMDDLKLMKERIVPMRWSDLSQWNGNLVFEGAQGLQLCEMNVKDMPYLTPSRPGIKNTLSMVTERGAKRVDVYYVSRTYITRHGPGPMPHENGAPFPNLNDTTNLTNKHQGSLRYSHFDVDVLKEAVRNDFHQTKDCSNITFSKNLVLTWCDKVPENGISFIEDRKIQTLSLQGFIRILKKKVGFHNVFTSFGPSASCIKD